MLQLRTENEKHGEPVPVGTPTNPKIQAKRKEDAPPPLEKGLAVRREEGFPSYDEADISFVSSQIKLLRIDRKKVLGLNIQTREILEKEQLKATNQRAQIMALNNAIDALGELLGDKYDSVAALREDFEGAEEDQVRF